MKCLTKGCGGGYCPACGVCPYCHGCTWVSHRDPEPPEHRLVLVRTAQFGRYFEVPPPSSFARVPPTGA